MTTSRYSVKQLSDLSGVTVRALHHYDEIGLLKPALRSEKRYRYYNHENLLRLQQILFYRELDFSLDQIRDILDDPEFDNNQALREHRSLLIKRRQQLDQLIHTLDRTLQTVKGDPEMGLKDKDLYAGFDQEKIDRWNREVEEQYDPKVVAESRRNVGKMSREQFKAVQQEGQRVTVAIAAIMDHEASSAEVQALIARHHAWIENFYVCPAEIYAGLGRLYVENPEFTAFYEKVAPGLAAFMSEAMEYFADNRL